ncbi:MAG: hypothetical protein HC824_18950, partial [Synechococcales cyanobacterium RM1_1_8]|nr:hypothetical protein [Synechococcales cyanobacterium RM1_1_8]
MSTWIWKFLTTDIKGLVAGEALPAGFEAAETVLRLATKLAEEGPKSQEIGPIVGQITSLLDVLNLPLGKFVQISLPFEEIAGDLLEFYRDKTHQEPGLGPCISLLSQAAYLESVKNILASPKLRPWLKKVGQEPVSPRVSQALLALGELTLSEETLRMAVIDFSRSDLAQAFNPIFAGRLTQLGLKREAAIAIAQRAAQLTEQRMRAPLKNSGERVQRLIEWYRIGGKAALGKFLSIDRYLDAEIRPPAEAKPTPEAFSLQELFVPPQAQPLTLAGDPVVGAAQFPLQQWLHQWLEDPQRCNRVLFIEGEAGRGKTTFCQMFADWARTHLHPAWTPVVIRVSEVPPLREQAFDRWLSEAIAQEFTLTDANWIGAANVRFLFMIDSIETLGLDRHPAAVLETFLAQISQFQTDCSGYLEREHRIVLTGRSLSLLDRPLAVPSNIDRLEILPMDGDLQESWLQQLAQRVGFRPDQFKLFLLNPALPNCIRELSCEPLFLGLLANMHHQGALDIDRFQHCSDAAAKVLLYSNLLDWVLAQNTEVSADQLRAVLRQAGLCSVQLGTETVPLGAIQDRLSRHHSTRTIPLPDNLVIRPPAMPLPIARLQPALPTRHGATFCISHRSFSQFLYAEQLRIGLENWAKLRKPGTATAAVDWEIYDLLGYGGLSREIVQFLLVMLNQSKTFEPEALFHRLQDFYLRWATGTMIDEEPPTLPQRKMQRLRSQQQYREHPLGQRQVDAYTGLNVMILLLELNRYARHREELKQTIIFYPNGRTSLAKHSQRLLHISHYSQCIGTGAFGKIVGPFLSNVHLGGSDLRGLDLRGVDLSGCNLSGCNLSGADLSGADLSGADLSGANLGGTDLSGANLRRVSLSRALMTGAHLVGAFLSNADLIGALLHGANLSRADLSLADLSLADLRGTTLNQADLSLADLRSANLSSALLHGAMLNRASFSCADLRQAGLSGANLSLADLSQADLRLADLSGANLEPGGPQRLRISRGRLIAGARTV